MPSKQFGLLINISPHSLIMLKIANTKSSSIEVWFTDQNSEPLQIEDNVNMTLIIVAIIKIRYWTEPKFRKYVKGYGFFSFPRKFGDTAAKTGIYAEKTSSKRVVQKKKKKNAKAAGNLIRNKIADKITSIDKSKEKEEIKKEEEISILPKTR